MLAGYAVRHPRTWHALKPIIEAAIGTPIGGRHVELPMIEPRLDRA